MDGVYVVELHGSLFFGNAGPLQRKLEGISGEIRSVVLHMGDVRFVDQSGVYMLIDLVEELQKNGATVFLAEIHPEPVDVMARLGLTPGIVPADCIFENAEDAIKKATEQAGRLQPTP